MGGERSEPSDIAPIGFASDCRSTIAPTLNKVTRLLSIPPLKGGAYFHPHLFIFVPLPSSCLFKSIGNTARRTGRTPQGRDETNRTSDEPSP
ncbi:hypothetical protein SPH9361_00548 [Sphingobium sp. CECT 9361]|nr:hypothetical protein SPH9361_00548 [Sphingobium sp. CECT 9361]